MPKKEQVRLTLNQTAFQLLNNTSNSTKIPKSELVEDLILNYLQPLRDKLLKLSQG